MLRSSLGSCRSLEETCEVELIIFVQVDLVYVGSLNLFSCVFEVGGVGNYLQYIGYPYTGV